MQIFEYPYVIVTILFLCFIVLAVVGLCFAVKGANTAKGKEEKGYINISKMESSFNRSGRQNENRCVFYTKVSLDNFRSLYSAEETRVVLSEIKKIFREVFIEDDDSEVSVYGEQNFVVFAKWDAETTRKNIAFCFSELNQCLLKHKARNMIDIRIGIYYAFGSQVTLDDAIGRAKQAYLLAKNQSLPYVEWNVTGGKALEKKIKIENSIEKEIDNNRFFLEYQPVLEAKTKRIVGAEVLSRLNSETEGVLTPGSFLSAVESVGVNEKFDYYIFEKNCKWIANDREQRELYTYAINFSRSTLCDPHFAERIISIVERYDLRYSCLAIEILEDKSICGVARQQMINNLIILKEKGVSILLDDFGSGCTTFGDLQNLDISVVKIDKIITQNAVTDTGFIILKNIIRTARDIGFKTLCEGVETQEQEASAINAGCDFLQGFYYYKPMPVAQLEQVLAKREFREE